MTLRCTGCGTTKTIEEIQRDHPNALSCCPERDMQPERVDEQNADLEGK